MDSAFSALRPITAAIYSKSSVVDVTHRDNHMPRVERDNPAMCGHCVSSSSWDVICATRICEGVLCTALASSFKVLCRHNCTSLAARATNLFGSCGPRRQHSQLKVHVEWAWDVDVWLDISSCKFGSVPTILFARPTKLAFEPLNVNNGTSP